MTSADDLWRRLSTISEAEVRSIARIERVPGARERAEVVYRAAAGTDQRAAGPRLAERGPIEVDDPCSPWARWAWHFTDPDWFTAESVIDDALAVLRAADLLPVDQVSAVTVAVLAILKLRTDRDDGRLVDPRLTDRQRDLDGLLPLFVTAKDPDRYVETTWINLADLALFHGETVGGRAGVRTIEGVAPSRNPRAVTVLAAGSFLRFIATFWDYLASTVLMLTVEGGPASGMTVSLTTDDRWLTSGSVDRRTAAAALIVPADDAIIDLAATANVRLRWLQAITAGSAIDHGMPVGAGHRDRPDAGGDTQFALWREDQLEPRGISRQSMDDEGAPGPRMSPRP